MNAAILVSRPGRAGLAVLLGLVCGCSEPSSEPPPGASEPKIVATTASPERVRQFCGDCHAYPPPESFPKANWPAEVRRGFDFHRKSDQKRDAPSIDDTIRYYVDHAPDAFPVIPRTKDDTGLSLAFHRREIAGPHADRPSALSFVGLASLSDSKRPDLLACDMGRGELLIRRAKDADSPLTVLAESLAHPAHAEVADLDNDGVKDILVADLGVPMPSDDRFGRVLWLKGKADGSFETIVLASELGRVCDVQPADFDGDGDLDLVVAVFGWRLVGEILYLEQRPGPDGRPEFVRRTIDNRHGTIHVPVVDLNRDGRPDFVALITQEHETIVAFLNAGGGQFTKKTLYSAPHPAYGSSGIQLADIDGDGDPDIVLSNGDVYDSPLLKPYHGVAWLENRGGDHPFERHTVGPLYGAHRALAADMDSDGDLDIVATSFLGEPFYGSMRREVGADAVVLFEQVARGQFTRHSLERETCDYPTFALGDLNSDGRPDIIAGRFVDFSFSGANVPARTGPAPAPIVVWENRGKSASK